MIYSYPSDLCVNEKHLNKHRMEIEDKRFEESMQQLLKLLFDILKLLKAKNRLGGETLYDNQDLCILLKLSKRSLQRLRSLGLLPYMQIGQKTFYLESDIEKYIQNQIDNKKTLGKSDNDNSP